MKRISEITDFVGVGIRSMSEDDAELIKEKSLKEYYAKDLLSDKSLFDEAIESFSDEVYITIDMDVFDPSIVSVGTPEPGGLGWYDILDFLKKVGERKILKLTSNKPTTAFSLPKILWLRNNEPENLISLCKSCHTQTNFKREDWTVYFQNKLNS